MKVKVIIAALLLAGAGMSANAQSTDDNWFLQGQLGASYSLDGTGIGKLISPAGQIAAGKYFNPYVGARLAVSGWRGRAGSGSRPAEGFYYGAATVDGLFNMSSLFCGSNPERFFNARLIAGVGYNRTFDEGASSFMARLGLQASFRLNKAFAQLDSLPQPQKDKLEFLCNECCWFGCTERRRCYEAVSRKNLGEVCEHRCTAPGAQEGYRFSKAMENPGFIGTADIRERYLPLGFSNFKLEGRGLGSALVLEFLLYYLTRPEYQIHVREAIYLDNMLDLF